METTIVYRGYVGIMEQRMDITTEERGYVAITEKKMETLFSPWPYSQLRSTRQNTNCHL